MSSVDQYNDAIAQIGCVICRRDTGQIVPAELHHVAEGSGKRSEFMKVPLCTEHHRGGNGLHGAGVKRFLMMCRLSTEYDLLGLVNEYRAKDGI